MKERPFAQSSPYYSHRIAPCRNSRSSLQERGAFLRLPAYNANVSVVIFVEEFNLFDGNWKSKGKTYSFPIQFRGPYENGWKTSLLSDAKRGSSSQRSGMKEFGAEKLVEERKAAYWFMETPVCEWVISEVKE